MQEGVKSSKRSMDDQAFVAMGLACPEEGSKKPGRLPETRRQSRPTASKSTESPRSGCDRQMYDDAPPAGKSQQAQTGRSEAGKRINDLMLEKTINRVKQAPQVKRRKKLCKAPSKNSPLKKCKRKREKDQTTGHLCRLDQPFIKEEICAESRTRKRALKASPNDDVFTRSSGSAESRAREELKE